MAEKQATSPAPAVKREIKPNKNRPFEINVSGRTFKGSTIVIVGKDEKDKDIEKIVESKTRFIPAAHMAILTAKSTPEAVKKLELKLIPLPVSGKLPVSDKQ